LVRVKRQAKLQVNDMSELQQENRALGLTTPLGKDKLVIQSFAMNEGISKLFLLKLEMLSEDETIKPDSIVGKSVTLRISTVEDQLDMQPKNQHVNGFVSRFYQGGIDGRVRTYHAEVVPWLWYLTQSSNIRIFQKKTVPEIIEKVFKDHGFTDFEIKVQGSFEPREYCVQYRETDFAFVSRLMEEEGIFYFFEQSEDKHKLIIANNPGIHKPARDFDKFQYVPKGGEKTAAGGIIDWDQSMEFRSGKFATNDYHFQAPRTSLLVNAPSVVKVGGNSKFELYDYPGYYAKRFDGESKMSKVPPDGERTVKLRMQEVEAGHKEASGSNTLPGMCSGFKFALDGHNDQDGDYVITGVRHRGQQSPPYYSNKRLPRAYENSFTCIPVEVPYRPQRLTPKPIVHGVQTAVVVGTAGEEIDTDEYGRVKVQFHWDREGKRDQNSSCWIRVATMWAGQQWGSICIPRMGQEVIVAFMEGDPDQPIVVGSVYNADNKPPYKLPDDKNWSGLVSRSTKDGDIETSNVIVFDDTKGKEMLYIRGEYDHRLSVENDEIHWVGNDRTTEIEQNDKLCVFHGDREIEIDEGNEKRTIKQGNREAIISMGNDTLTIKLGNQTTKLDLGKSATEAMQSIEFKVGQSSLKIDQMGVTIKGMMINVESTIQTAVKGTMTQVQGSAMLQVSGGIMMLG
jgi:type VI secretion system secreted protein VgrG